MNIKQMIKKLGGNKTQIAKAAGITYEQLSNAERRGSKVAELKDGTFILLRKDSTIFRSIYERE